MLAEQFWPPFQKALIAAFSIVASSSTASSSTMNGDLPPISSPTTFMFNSPA